MEESESSNYEIMDDSINLKIYENAINFGVVDAISVSSQSILDIGCGSGVHAKYLKNLGKTVDGITISEAEAKIASNYCENVYVHNLENGLPSLNKKYDSIICSHVLEHIVYPEKLLINIKDYMHKNSELIIAVPNLLHYKSRLKLLFGTFEYHENGIWDYTHVKWYTFKSLEKLMVLFQFSIIIVWVTGELPFYSITKYIPITIRKNIFNFLVWISPGLFGGQILIKVKT